MERPYRTFGEVQAALIADGWTVRDVALWAALERHQHAEGKPGTWHWIERA